MKDLHAKHQKNLPTSPENSRETNKYINIKTEGRCLMGPYNFADEKTEKSGNRF